MAQTWYIVHTYTGYEAKIERTIRMMLDAKELDPEVVLDVKVPVKEIVEVKDNKKKVRKDKFLPGYIMLNLNLPDLGWKKICSAIRHIEGVTGFVGTNPSDRPRPISVSEATRLLEQTGEIKAEKESAVSSYEIGNQVKITDGPFATFSGSVEEILADKNKLRVVVEIFGRQTPVEVDVTQVERIVV